MTRQEVYERLLPVFRDVFDDKTIKIDDKTSSSDIVGWDSLVHIQLIDSVQDEFAVEFGVEEAYTMRHVGDLVTMIIKAVDEK